jgi:hypothetical protein
LLEREKLPRTRRVLPFCVSSGFGVSRGFRNE